MVAVTTPSINRDLDVSLKETGEWGGIRCADSHRDDSPVRKGLEGLTGVTPTQRPTLIRQIMLDLLGGVVNEGGHTGGLGQVRHRVQGSYAHQ